MANHYLIDDTKSYPSRICYTDEDVQNMGDVLRLLIRLHSCINVANQLAVYVPDVTKVVETAFLYNIIRRSAFAHIKSRFSDGRKPNAALKISLEDDIHIAHKFCTLLVTSSVFANSFKPVFTYEQIYHILALGRL